MAEGNPKNQYKLKEGGIRHNMGTGGTSFHMDMPLIVGVGVVRVFAQKQTLTSLRSHMEDKYP